MPIKFVAAVIAAISLSAVPTWAQESEGQYAADLQRIIAETAAGTCPADLMAEQLLAACRQQLPQMSAGLASLGAVQSVTFTGAEERPTGRVETYAVVFANGVTLTWGIGAKTDGKYDTAYASS